MQVNREYEDLRGDGQIMLFLRTEGKKPNYYVRVSIPKSTGYKTVSTKTKNRNLAVKFAMDLYDEYNHVVQTGGSLHSKSYSAVVDEWSIHRTNSYKPNSKDRTISYVKLYSVDYFGSFKIDKITSKDFYDFWDWRRTNFKKKKPTDETLNRERTSIQSVLKFGFQRGYTTDQITIPRIKTNGISRRPTFTMDEWRKITKGMRQWVEEGRPVGKWRDRFLLQQYVLLMSNSGVRIGEMRNLKWEDTSSIVTDEGTQLVLRVDGKTGERDVVLNPGSDVYLKRLYDLRLEELNNERPPSNEYVFLSRRSKKPYSTFKTSFNSMLEFCGIELSKNGLNRTIYSLRHFYATQRLKGNINPYHLSKQMGTSVEMIQKFYGHILTLDVIDSITKSTKQKGSKSTNAKQYPFD